VKKITEIAFGFSIVVGLCVIWFYAGKTKGRSEIFELLQDKTIFEQDYNLKGEN